MQVELPVTAERAIEHLEECHRTEASHYRVLCIGLRVEHGNVEQLTTTARTHFRKLSRYVHPDKCSHPVGIAVAPLLSGALLY